MLKNVINEIKANLTKDICLYRKSLQILNENIIEFIAERDEELLEKYFKG